MQETLLVLGFADPIVAIDLEQLARILGRDAQLACSNRLGRRHQTDRCLARSLGTVARQDLLTHPAQDAHVFAKTWPDKATLVVGAEPVDLENGRRTRRALAHFEPVRPVVGHVVTAEWEHGHRIPADNPNRACGRGGRFGSHRGADEHTVLPVERAVYQWDCARTAAAEQNGADRYALWVLPVRRDGRIVGGGGREARVGVGSPGAGRRRPRITLPIRQALGDRAVDTLPPDSAVLGQCDVGED